MENVNDINSSAYSVNSNMESSIPSEFLSDVPSDVIIHSRIKYGTKPEMIKGLLMEYASKTSVHGVRYIFERKRYLLDRILWVVAFLISFSYSCVVIREVHLKWLDSPVIVGFDEALIPIHRIPFPTVTICPESKMETEIFNFTEIYEQFTSGGYTLSDEEMERLSATLHICDREVAEKIASDLPTNIEPSIGEVLRGMAISKNETAPFCKWSNRFYLCEHIFSLVATDEGICYQFNGLPPSYLYRNESYPTEIPDDIEVDFNKNVDRQPNDTPIEYTGSWSLEEGYINQTEEAYPLRVLMASARTAFVALLQGLGHNLDYQCRSLRQGYKVYLNSPQNIVHSTSSYFLVRHKQEIIVQVYPVYMSTSKAVRKFTPERRQCFFNSERYLRFFNYYSESNCQFECLTNFTIKRCGCVKFSMPRPDNVRMCNHADIECYNTAEEELALVQQHEVMQSAKNPQFKSECNCLPGCVSLKYDFDISQARLDGLGTVIANNDSYDEHPDFMWSRLTVHFKEQQFTAMKRSELYSISTLIANWGGVLSLFIGFSTISIFEFIYFITVRLKYSLDMRKKSNAVAPDPCYVNQ